MPLRTAPVTRPYVRELNEWERACNRPNGPHYQRIVLPISQPYQGKEAVQVVGFNYEGSIVVDTPVHTLVIQRGVVLVDVLDVDNAFHNGWLYQPRATTESEKQAGLVRVSKL